MAGSAVRDELNRPRDLRSSSANVWSIRPFLGELSVLGIALSSGEKVKEEDRPRGIIRSLSLKKIIITDAPRRGSPIIVEISRL